VSLYGLFAAITSLFPWTIVAQTVSPEGGNVTLVTLLAQVGLSAVFLWQWMQERKERRETQALFVQFMEKFGPALVESTETLERVVSSMSIQVERASPERRDLDRLERAINDFESKLKSNDQ
jgi:hypothetical protein